MKDFIDTTISGGILPYRTPDGVHFAFPGSDLIQSVSLAGTFNCWVGDELMLTLEAEGNWGITLPISMGRHLYKFVVNGTEWIPDPLNPWISEDAQNNSCIIVTERGDVLVRQEGISKIQPGYMHQVHQALKSPDWLQGSVIYELSVRAFGGTFKGVQERLPYLQDLGCSVLWIMPIYPIGQKNRRGTLGDPYAVQDYSSIDPELGTEAEFRALVDDAHRLGFKVVLDWTLNRSSVDHPWTVQHPEWYTCKDDGEVYYRVPNRTDFAGFDFSNRELRHQLIQDMLVLWKRFNLDGFRFDDSDITPLDFLEEIRAALQEANSDIMVISQAYDEFHHLKACDLTYEGGTRDMILQVAHGQKTARDLAALWEVATYSFPKNALRMRWLEEKEQGRAFRFYGPELHLAAASILLTLDGVPCLLMGQEWNEMRWEDWTTLFEPGQLDRESFDQKTYQHYRALLRLRRQNVALQKGAVTFIEMPEAQVVRFRRSFEHEVIQVTVNLSRQAAELKAEGEVLYAEQASGGRIKGLGTLVEKIR